MRDARTGPGFRTCIQGKRGILRKANKQYIRMIPSLSLRSSTRNRLLILAGLYLLLGSIALMCLESSSSANPLPGLDEALAARQDLWGLAAMRQVDGPSYEFFKELLPPLRYVNADFRYYPIILSAPDSSQKMRLVSNGSGINPRAVLKTWNEKGVPVSFFVGDNQNVFGSDLRRLKGPF